MSEVLKLPVQIHSGSHPGRQAAAVRSLLPHVQAVSEPRHARDRLMLAVIALPKI